MGTKELIPYRNSTQIVSEIVTLVESSGQEGIQITPLCQKANLAHSRLRNFLTTLTGSGLINKISYDGKHTFVISDKGRLYLEEYKRFSEIAGSFGLEL